MVPFHYKIHILHAINISPQRVQKMYVKTQTNVLFTQSISSINYSYFFGLKIISSFSDVTASLDENDDVNLSTDDVSLSTDDDDIIVIFVSYVAKLE